MSPVGQTRDAGWEIGVSRTVPHPLEEVWGAITSRHGVAAWLGADVDLPEARGAAYETADGTVGEIRSHHPLDRLRLTWQPPGWSHDTIVQVTVRTAASGTTIGFHQERLADAEERERQRAHWTAALDRVVAQLEG